ncbi:hypothetical protein V1264_008878 [Littorina saxatilis]|uniref:Uncharacterized protein n=1 Tax=Littorina saxatilis TaxID=31220 RepID=A0AAN9AQ64_9CAEN
MYTQNYAAWSQAMRESYGSPKPYMRQSWPVHPHSQQPVMRQPGSIEPTARPTWISHHNPTVKPGTELANQKFAETYGGQQQVQGQPHPQTTGEHINWTRKAHMVHDRPAQANKAAAAPTEAGADAYGNTWAQGVCGCTEDVNICLCVLCCTPCAACQTARDMDEFVCLPCCSMCPWLSFTACLVGHPCPWLFAARSKVRTRLAFEGSMCDDCLVATCCYPCGLCQLMREVKLAKAYGKM